MITKEDWEAKYNLLRAKFSTKLFGAIGTPIEKLITNKKLKRKAKIASAFPNAEILDDAIGFILYAILGGIAYGIISDFGLKALACVLGGILVGLSFYSAHNFNKERKAESLIHTREERFLEKYFFYEYKEKEEVLFKEVTAAINGKDLADFCTFKLKINEEVKSDISTFAKMYSSLNAIKDILGD